MRNPRVAPIPRLNYVFAVSFLSSKGDGSWTPPRVHEFHENGKKDPKQIAGEIAYRRCAVTERGVRVEYLGLQEYDNHEAPITQMCCFTLEIRKEDKL